MKEQKRTSPEANASLDNPSNATIEHVAKEALTGPTPSSGVEERILALARRSAASTPTGLQPFRWGAIAAAASLLLALGVWQLSQTGSTAESTYTAIDGIEAIVLFTQRGEEAQLANDARTSREEQIQELATRLLELEGLEAPEPFTLPEVEASPEPHSTEIQLHRTRALQA